MLTTQHAVDFADEACLVDLWQQGLSHEAMAQRLGCPAGTVKSRAYALVRSIWAVRPCSAFGRSA